MFNPERLSLIVQPVGDGGIRFYSYPTDDTEATVTAAGYATNAADYGLRTYDLIFVTPITGATDTYILAVDTIDADGHATLASPGPIGDLLAANNLSDLSNVLTARGNLGTYVDRAAVAAATVPADIDNIVVEAYDATVDPSLGRANFRVATLAEYNATATSLRLTDAGGRYFIIEEQAIHPAMAGAVNDGATDDTTALTEALATSKPVHVTGTLAANTIQMRSNTMLVGAPDHTFKQTTPSDIGGFLISRVVGDDTNQPNIKALFVNLDGSEYREPYKFTAVAGSTDTVVILDSSASAVDDFYNGLILTAVDGAGISGSNRFITDYVGSTRTATLSGALLGTPAAGDPIWIGWNEAAIGIGGGAEEVLILGSKIDGYDPLLMIPFGGGGKLNFEQGAKDGKAAFNTIKNQAHGLFVQGKAGNGSNGLRAYTFGIDLSHTYVENCGSVLEVGAVTGGAITADTDDMQVTVSSVHYRNCGHAPWRLVNSDNQKSSIIALMRAQKVVIGSVIGYNEPGYPATSPGYPGDVGFPFSSTKMIGYGLTGPIGALCRGIMRDCTIKHLEHTGDVDNVLVYGRHRALGFDAGSWSAGSMNAHNNDFRFILHGDCDTIVAVDSNATYRPTSGDLINNRVFAQVNAATTSLVDANMATFDWPLCTLVEAGTGKTVVGTPKQIIRAGNTFALFDDIYTDLRNELLITIPDDTVVRINPPRRNGFMSFCLAPNTTAATGVEGMIYYGTFGAAQAVAMAIGTNVTIGTTALTDGTGDGVDTDINIAVTTDATDGIYFKNRLGASYTFRVVFS